MKVIKNDIIPFNGFSAINLFGILFVRKNVVLTKRLLNHETIHTAQMKELFYVFFYVWYIVEWLIKLLFYSDAYRNVSFEREAYENENDSGFLSKRKKFNFLKYV